MIPCPYRLYPLNSDIGGDIAATFDFYRDLRKLATEEQVYFIVDEVQTGGGISGKWWAHEHWDLETPPDIVTFAKKMCTGGYYHNDVTRKQDKIRCSEAELPTLFSVRRFGYS